MSSDGIPKHDFSQPQYTFPTKTRSTLYLCWMCELGRVKTQQKTPEKSSTSPLPDSSNDDSLPPPVPITLCQRCLSPVGRGYHHPQPCGLAQRRESLKKLVSADSKTAEVFAADVIRQKFIESSTEDNTISLATRSGRLLVTYTKAKQGESCSLCQRPHPF